MPRLRTGSNEDQEFGLKLRLARHTAGLSQAQLGSVLGVTYQQVQKYEAGANRIRFTALNRICEVLDVPHTFFQPSALSDDGPEDQGFAGIDQGMVREVSNLIKAYCRIESTRLRRSLLALAVEMGRHPVADGNDGRA